MNSLSIELEKRSGGSDEETLRRHLRQLQLVTDAVPALMSYIDRDLRYLTCNGAYQAWFGLSPGELIGKTMPEVLGEAAWQAVRPHVEAALAGENKEFETEANYRFGGRRWIHAIYTPHRDAGGQVEGIVVMVTDITSRKQAEEELRWREERFRAFVTTTSAVVYRMSPDWTEMRHLVGHDFIADAESPTRSWLETYIPPDDQPRVMAAVREAIRTKTPYQLEHRVIRVDGTLGWTFSRAIPLLNAQGEIIEWFGAATDVTERHRAEQSLLESEERYRSLFNTIDEGFCVIEMLFDGEEKPVDYRFIEVNPAFEQQTGLHGATGKRMLEFVSEIEPHWLENYGRVAMTGEPIRFADEYKSLHSWFDVYAFRVGVPEHRRVAVLFNNITSRKASEHVIRESEERFRNMSNHSPMMLWVTDAQGSCTHLNERWFEFTGQTVETGLGFGWLDAVHPEDRQRAGETFLGANEKRENFQVEYRLRNRDGRYRWALDTASPRFAERGEFLGYIGSVVDIQERKETENALREAKEQAERASRAKDHFLAQLSHELRTPLTPVLMTASALKEDETLPEGVREQLGMMERNVALEARLIDDLLDLTRVTRGKLILRTEPCDVHALLAHVGEMVRDEARAKRLQVALDLSAVHSRVQGDPARLQQVLWNLLLNAVKFTAPAGQVRVHSYNRNPGDSHLLCIDVTDTGIGFDPSSGDRIFEPFEQGSAGADQRFPGLGLGLAIARALVDLHGGHIRARSSGLGCGATFTIELPAIVAPAGATVTGANESMTPAEESGKELPMRLLIVEDDQATLQVLSRLLSRAGHQVAPASNIATARALAAAQEFDAVISDVGLPDGTGVELMEHLQAAYGLPGIALSGYGMEEDVQRSTRAGFSAHLVKPIDVGELRRVLRLLPAPER